MFGLALLFVCVSSVVLAFRSPCLDKRELVFVLIVHLFVSYAHVNLCHFFSSSWCRGFAVASACGSSWTFLFYLLLRTALAIAIYFLRDSTGYLGWSKAHFVIQRTTLLFMANFQLVLALTLRQIRAITIKFLRHLHCDYSNEPVPWQNDCVMPHQQLWFQDAFPVSNIY